MNVTVFQKFEKCSVNFIHGDFFMVCVLCNMQFNCKLPGGTTMHLRHTHAHMHSHTHTCIRTHTHSHTHSHSMILGTHLFGPTGA